MRALATIVCLTFSSLGAQQPSVLSSHDTDLTVMRPQSCPIGIDARQQQRAPYLLADSVSPAMHPVYTIVLQAPEAKAVREVVIELAGPTGPHTEAIVTNNAGAAEAVEPFTLAKMRTTDVTTARLTSVRWIDLVKVTYADGSSWSRGTQNSCRVIPNGFLLVQHAGLRR